MSPFPTIAQLRLALLAQFCETLKITLMLLVRNFLRKDSGH
jgi:hypothetical protein